jgi:hypothetical protein
MPLATASQILQDYSLELALPGINATFGTTSRSVTRRIITVTSTSNPVGASTLTVRANTNTGGTITGNTVIKAGTALSFSSDAPTQIPSLVFAKIRQQAIVLNDVTLTDSSTSSITISPLSRPIQAGAIADFIVGLIPLSGIQTMDMANQETMVDTTHFGSGAGTETAIVRTAKSFSISGVALAGDEGLETIVKRVGAFDGYLFGREVFAVATMPDGERFEGFAKITALNFPANQNEVKKYSFTLTYQGRTFAWYTPYDYSSPFIIDLTPDVNGTGFVVSANLTAQFNQAITLGAGTATIVLASNPATTITTALTRTTTTVANDTLTIDPTSNLTGNTDYYVLISPTAVVGFAGIDDNSWTFRTA